MNLSEWQVLSGAYMPAWEDRIEIAMRNLPPGSRPGWLIAYAILQMHKYIPSYL